MDAAQLQLAEDADRVVRPETAGGGAVVAVDGEGLGEEFAGEDVGVVSAGSNGDVRGEGDGHGEDESAGIVGVLAEEVDASGRDAVYRFAGRVVRGLGAVIADCRQSSSSPQTS